MPLCIVRFINTVRFCLSFIAQFGSVNAAASQLLTLFLFVFLSQCTVCCYYTFALFYFLVCYCCRRHRSCCAFVVFTLYAHCAPQYHMHAYMYFTCILRCMHGSKSFIFTTYSFHELWSFDTWHGIIANNVGTPSPSSFSCSHSFNHVKSFLFISISYFHRSIVFVSHSKTELSSTNWIHMAKGILKTIYFECHLR